MYIYTYIIFTKNAGVTKNVKKQRVNAVSEVQESAAAVL